MPLAVLLLFTAAPAVDPAPKQMDMVIRNVTIHDGSGKAGVKGDIAIAGERIVGVGTFDIAGKPKMIDGTGLIAAPGFIDLHTHCDAGVVAEGSLRANKCYLTQG